MNIRAPIILLLTLAEVWWFGAHCTAYLSDIKELFEKRIISLRLTHLPIF
jgi:hypothetical protein